MAKALWVRACRDTGKHRPVLEAKTCHMQTHSCLTAPRTFPVERHHILPVYSEGKGRRIKGGSGAVWPMYACLLNNHSPSVPGMFLSYMPLSPVSFTRHLQRYLHKSPLPSCESLLSMYGLRSSKPKPVSRDKMLLGILSQRSAGWRVGQIRTEGATCHLHAVLAGLCLTSC